MKNLKINIWTGILDIINCILLQYHGRLFLVLLLVMHLGALT
jgi:hypothetical protein